MLLQYELKATRKQESNPHPHSLYATIFPSIHLHPPYPRKVNESTKKDRDIYKSSALHKSNVQNKIYSEIYGKWKFNILSLFYSKIPSGVTDSPRAITITITLIAVAKAFIPGLGFSSSGSIGTGSIKELRNSVMNTSCMWALRL